MTAQSQTKFIVVMHPELVDQLDMGFSPMDGMVAIKGVFDGLPKVHKSRESKRVRRTRRKSFKVYTGCFEWDPSMGFSYVQIGQQLHVVELWFDQKLGETNCEKVDSVIVEPCE